MHRLFQLATSCRVCIHALYLIFGVILIIWLAAGLQAGPSGVYLFLIYDVATDSNRLYFILSFVPAFAAGFSIIGYTLKLPRVDFFSRIIAINIVTYSFLGLGLSTLRLPLVSREVFIYEFLLSIVLLVGYYLLRNKLFPPHAGVVDDSDIEAIRRHPALNAEKTTIDVAAFNNFDVVILNLRQNLSPQETHLLTDLAQKRIPVHDTNAFIERIWGRIPLNDLTTAEIETFTPPPVYKNVKRLGELALILFFAPLLALFAVVIAIAIRLDSHGPALFHQQRTGYRGENFTMLKFRSMVFNHGEGGLLVENADKRITRVGRVLRRFRLDELPQVWNVLRGEMSLIGPRPEQEKLSGRFSQLIPFYGFRHTVPPGISGWAQVMYGYTVTDEQARGKLEFDFYYIKHMSAWLDFVILLKTLRTIILGSGVR